MLPGATQAQISSDWVKKNTDELPRIVGVREIKDRQEILKIDLLKINQKCSYVFCSIKHQQRRNDNFPNEEILNTHFPDG